MEGCNGGGHEASPLEVIQRVVGGKWKIPIIWTLRDTKRFNELHRLFPGITQTMLTKQLRELEKDGFVHREIYKEIPPKVEYSLTATGAGFLPIIQKMCDWVKENYI
ncbi:MAG: helix-turn-helix transcriptional regulator [Spirochaetes bacterium]|nr:helix-turn-helix transcriptional regulator [Spirochaetota bacterium]